MSTQWDPDDAYDPHRLEKQEALKLPPIHGVLPYDGARNPLTRSNTAHRILMPIVTPATKGVPKAYYFDGESEWAVAMEALLDPDLYALDVQLPFFRFRHSKRGRVTFPKHYFDLRITLRNGFRLAIYVKNGSRLSRPETQDEISAIENAMPEDLADEMAVVNADDYTRPFRINLHEFWIAWDDPDDQADAHVEERARSCSYWSAQDLISKCDLPSNRAFPAIQRLIARRVLGADWYSVISLQSRVWMT